MRDISFLSVFPHPVTWNLWWGRLKFRVVVSVRNIISREDELQLPRACSSHLQKPLIPIQRGCYCCILQSNTLLKSFQKRANIKDEELGPLSFLIPIHRSCYRCSPDLLKIALPYYSAIILTCVLKC